jgi:hypothetical protein
VGVAGIIGSLRLLLLNVHPHFDAVEQTILWGVLLGGIADFTVSALLFGFAEAILEQELRGFVITNHELCVLSV